MGEEQRHGRGGVRGRLGGRVGKAREPGAQRAELGEGLRGRLLQGLRNRCRLGRQRVELAHGGVELDLQARALGGLQVDRLRAAEGMLLGWAGARPRADVGRDRGQRGGLGVGVERLQPVERDGRGRRALADEADDLGERAEGRLSRGRQRRMQQLGDAVELVARAAQPRRVARLGQGLRARRQRAPELERERLLVGGARVQLQADVAQPGLHQAVVHHRERGHLLGDEQHRLAVVRGGGDQVGDGLRLARAGRALHHQAGAVADLLDDLGLRGVGVDHLDDARGVEQRVEAVLGAEERRIGLEAVGEQALQQGVGGERAFGPVRRVEVAVHQQLGEGEEAELHAVGVHRPAALAGGRLAHQGVVLRRRPALGLVHLGQPDREVLAQALLQRQVGAEVVLAANQVEGRAALVAHELHRQQHQRRLAHHVGGGRLLPAQEAEREIEQVHALLLLGRARVAGQAQQPARERIGAEGRLQEVVGEPARVLVGRRLRQGQRQLAGCVGLVLAERAKAHPTPLQAQDREHLVGALVDHVEAVGACVGAVDVDQPVARAGLEQLAARGVEGAGDGRGRVVGHRRGRGGLAGGSEPRIVLQDRLSLHRVALESGRGGAPRGAAPRE